MHDKPLALRLSLKTSLTSAHKPPSRQGCLQLSVGRFAPLPTRYARYASAPLRGYAPDAVVCPCA